MDGGFGSIVGLEKGFFKNHSLGVKFINNYFSPREEKVEDKYGEVHDLGNYQKHNDQSFIFEYKYYFDFNDFRNRTGVSFYTSLNYKIGKKTINKDRNYENDFYFQKIDYNYIGPAIGFVFGNAPGWSIDTQISYLTGKKDKSTNFEGLNEYNLKETYSTNYFRFEFLVAYNFDF